MKKRIISVLLATALAGTLSACGEAKPSASDITGDRNVAVDETEENEEVKLPDGLGMTDEETEGEAEDETAEATADADTEAEEARTKKPSGVVFGSDEAAGYKDFAYLMEAIIATSETKSGNKVSYSVFIPDDEYSYISGARANSGRMGVDFEIDIAPYLQYDAEDYTIEENLEEYVNAQIEYASDNYYNMVSSDVKTLPDGAASCEVSYMKYDSYNGEYHPYFVQYNLKEMEDGLYALSVVTVDADETTGKTAAMLTELSDFYQMDIGYDDSFADRKKAEFESSDDYNPDAINIGFMSFELPDGWAEDEDESSYDSYVFAPNGNYAMADSAIIISNDYSSDDVISVLLSDEEYTKSYFESMFDSAGEEFSVDDIQVEDMGETFIGRTVKVSVTASDGSGAGEIILYMGQNDYDLYGVFATVWENDASAYEAIDMIFETGSVR